MDKKEYTAIELAKAILEKAKGVVADVLAKASSNPANQDSAQMKEFKIPAQAPQEPAGQAHDKPIAKQPLQLKKFLDNVQSKRMFKAQHESKHDRCVGHVKEQSPQIENPHAACVAAGVKPEKWSK